MIRFRMLIAVLTFLLIPINSGCTTWDIESVRRIATLTDFGSGTGVEIRKHRRNPLHQTLNLVGQGGPKPSEQTEQFLRRMDLLDQYQADPQKLLIELQDQTASNTSLAQLNVLAELSFVQGETARLAGDINQAGQLLVTASMASYRYLFDPELDAYRNAYDPQFRRVCDIYNSSLEGILRIMKDQGTLRPGGSFQASALGGHPLQLTVAIDGRWKNQNFDKFEFVSDFETEGLKNIYHTYGLGVPLIGVRAAGEPGDVSEQYYPAGLTLPLTAFIHVVHGHDEMDPDAIHECVLQLVDPLETTQVNVGGRMAPLESDITTPLAYYLDDPLLSTRWFATFALLDGDFAKQFRGLYMLEPYDPEKIPVVMVHGLWSSPVTWTAMFNDLRADKRLRDNYQFWFYLYPTGQPFWVSARDMRADLNTARKTLDPEYRSRALDHMVLVGHSMGGLVSRMQTIDSGDEFWRIVSDDSMVQLEGDDKTIGEIQELMYFQANPSIRRVITLGTPHRGSNMANSITKWISHKLFRLPNAFTTRYGDIVNSNPKVFDNPAFLTINTSIDSLAPDSPVFDAMKRARRSPLVTYHNIVGEHRKGGVQEWLGLVSEQSDGVVEVESAMAIDAESVVKVQAEHSFVHQHPRSVLEVQRILLQHLDEIMGQCEVANVRFDEPLVGEVPYGVNRIQWSLENTQPSLDPRLRR